MIPGIRKSAPLSAIDPRSAVADFYAPHPGKRAENSDSISCASRVSGHKVTASSPMRTKRHKRRRIQKDAAPALLQV
jgi:hypothetical protein